MHVKFCGATRTVTGSCHLLTLENGYKVLLDCGLYQGNDADFRDFNERWLFDPVEIDVLLLSHAHIDHCGRIPKLVKDGFQGEIICTKATADLCAIMLMDSAMIQEKDAELENKHIKDPEKFVKPLYTTQDVRICLGHFVSIGYEKWHRVNEQIEAQFRDSGHILGSASITLKIAEEGRETFYFGFTGDIGRPHRPILKDPVPMPELNYLISESTYGGRAHAPNVKEEARFLKILHETCIEAKGKLIIPAFSVGRTQEIVFMMDKLNSAGLLPKIPVYVDSPLAINATEIYRSNPDCFDSAILDYMVQDPDPFGFNSLIYIQDVESSKQLNYSKEPCVIISASGMMEGGRIRHHIFNNIENPNNTLLIVGFAAEHTLGGRLRSGVKSIYLFGEEKEVRARIEIMDSFSAHGDEGEMLNYLENQNRKKLKSIFLVHGEYEAQFNFRQALLLNGYNHIEIPTLGQEIEIRTKDTLRME